MSDESDAAYLECPGQRGGLLFTVRGEGRRLVYRIGAQPRSDGGSPALPVMSGDDMK